MPYPVLRFLLSLLSFLCIFSRLPACFSLPPCSSRNSHNQLLRSATPATRLFQKLCRPSVAFLEPQPLVVDCCVGRSIKFLVNVLVVVPVIVYPPIYLSCPLLFFPGVFTLLSVVQAPHHLRWNIPVKRVEQLGVLLPALFHGEQSVRNVFATSREIAPPNAPGSAGCIP